MEKNMRFLVTGQLSLVLGIACSIVNAYYLNHVPILDFMCGFLFGLSMVMNLTFLIRYSYARKRE